MAEQSITCPRCSMTSYNPTDVRMGYCGNCRAFTRDESPSPQAVRHGPTRPPVGMPLSTKVLVVLLLVAALFFACWYVVENVVVN